MLQRLYAWTLSLAARKTAEVWLAFIAFVESSVFLVPADVLFLPMALADPIVLIVMLWLRLLLPP